MGFGQGLWGQFKQGGAPTEKSVTQSDSINLVHRGVVDEVGIDEEEDRHIHRLSSIKPLLLKAEALDFAEVGCDLPGRDAIGGHPDDVLVALVRCREECQCRLARQNTDFPLLRSELPWHDVRHRPIECDP